MSQGFFSVQETASLGGGTYTGTLGIVAGTVSAPGMFFSGDTNNGIYSSVADNFGIVTNGVEAIRVNNKQFVGINQTSKLAQLSVTGPANFTGTGTVSTTASSATVTGVGTLFTTQTAIGDRLTINGETRAVKSIASDTSLTLDSNMTGSNSGVAYTVLKSIFSTINNSGNIQLVNTDSGNLLILIGSTFPDISSTVPTGVLISTNSASDALVLNNNAANAVSLRFNHSATAAATTSGNVITSTRDNNLYSGNSLLTIFSGGQITTNSLLIGNIGNAVSQLRSFIGINTIVTSNPSTFTVINDASVTGVGTVSNSGGGTTVTGVSTFFTRQCAIGDRFVVNGETVVITAIASATSLTVSPAIVGANAGVAFTVSKTIASFRDSSGVPQFYISDQGITTSAAGQRVATRVVTASGAVTVTNVDFLVEVNKTVGAATTVNLPAGVTGQRFIIKDGKGDAAANNITLTPAAGNIDNAATYVMATNLQSADIIYDGTMWVVC